MKSKDPLSTEAQHEIDLYLTQNNLEDDSIPELKSIPVDMFASDYQKPSRQRKHHSGKKDRRRDSDNW